MNWKFILVVIIICTVIIVSIYRWQAKRELQEEAQQAVKLPSKNIPEEVKFLIGVSEKVFARSEKVGFDGLTDPERVFYCVWILEGQVNNGGFDQFFFNSSGNYSTETVDALEKIGAAKTAGIVRRANSVFKNGQPSKNWTARQEELLAMPESVTQILTQLDKEFYKYEEDLSKLLYEFVTKHRAEFPDV
jgi:hypothetical protein